ncbi:MAG: T9SS type A sorting domain-containing protein [Flavobacteriales bacterium]|nr:T9SS type A sorting domain-containing protein [Flavobacteriales bacterium]
MRKFLFLPIALLFFVASASAQQLHCGTSEKMQAQLAANPQLAVVRQDIESFTERWMEEHANDAQRAVITIPVVVHVVYKTTAQNISDEQIQSQIDVLNEDYRKQNADVSGVPSVWTSRVADCEIQFALAAQDPSGILTNGITRTETTVSDWGGSDNVKYTSQGGYNAWPNTDYLNIWVCNIGSGLLGYAYQPGISASLDGVVIGYRYFGRVGSLSASYDEGRTATHEIAHYLNLDHLWGAGGSNTNCTADDGVSDTPKQTDPNYGCNTTFPYLTCGSSEVNSDMFNNYMDYGNDDCLFFFTNGQKARMLATLNGPRASIKDSEGLIPGEVGIDDQLLSALIIYPNPSNGMMNIRLDRGVNTVTDIRVLDISGRVVFAQSNVNLSFANHTLNLSELSAGTYVLELSSVNGRVSKQINILD